MQSRIQFKRDLTHSSPNKINIEAVASLWGRMHDRAQQQLSFLLEEYYRACDDLFHDLSNRADSSQEERHHFDVMRELRLSKSGASLRFQQAITENFRHILQGNEPDLDEDSPAVAVVDSDRLEIDLACKDMVRRCHEENATLCNSLIHKLIQLLGRPVPEERAVETLNPLDPSYLCRAFVQSCIQPLEVGIKSKIILLKQFERRFLSQIQPVYQQLVHLLVRSGYTAEPPPVQPSEEVGYATTEPVVQPLQQGQTAAIDMTTPGLDELLALCNDLKSRTGAPKAQYIDHSHNPGPILATDQLTQLLQGVNPATMLPIDGQEPRNLIQPIVEKLLLGHQPKAPPSALTANDDDIINLVSMFFDFVLDDENIALPIRFQISRLQLAILKQALRDKQFFNSSDHPARRLINELAHIGLGYCVENYRRDSLYKRIRLIIDRINESESISRQLFVRANALLARVVKHDAKQATLVDQGAPKIEGNNIALVTARRAVDKELIERLEHCQVAKTIAEFLLDHWRKVLVAIFLEQGQQSRLWHSSTQVIDDLAWVCAPHGDSRSRQRLEKLKADLILRLSAGLSAAYSKRSEYQPYLQQIVGTLVKAEKGRLPESELQVLSRPQLEWLLSGESEQDEPSTAIERLQEKHRTVSLEYIEKSENVAVGTWLEYYDPGTDKRLRCKLFSKRVVDGVYIFTDRFDGLVLEKNPTEFAHDMQCQRVRVLDGRPLFERTLEKIMVTLKSTVFARAGA